MWPDVSSATPKLLHVFSTFAVGGPQARTAELIHAFGPAMEHVLIAADGRTDAIGAFDLARAVRLVPVRFAKGRGIAPGNLIRVRRLLRAERPALMLTYNFGALEAALANRLWPLCPHLHFEEGFGPEESAGRQLRRRVWLRRLALGGGTRIVVPSRTLERIAVQRWGFSADRVVYAPNGVDLERFADRPVGGATVVERRPGEVLIGTVGALRPEKNLARLLRAFAALPASPPTRLVVVGDGPERQRLAALTAELGVADRVILTGQLAHPERVLALLDLFALSSDTEQMPISLLEAMAARLPVVATDVGDVAAVLPAAQHAFVVDRAAEALFVSAMTRLIADDALRRNLGTENHARVRRHFERTAMVARYRDLLASSMGMAGGHLSRDRRDRAESAPT
jgi:glycosyltransferase involved in cell wall biosynthesis